MKVIAMSRLMLERWEKNIDVPHAIITIGDPAPKGKSEGGTKANLSYDNPHLVDVLWMQFYDLDMSLVEMPGEVRAIQKEYGHGLFTEEHAKKILEFLDAMKDEVELIACSCSAGVSRSSAVAAAILRILTGSDSKIFDDARFIPNRFVYRTILNVWAKEK